MTAFAHHNGAPRIYNEDMARTGPRQVGSTLAQIRSAVDDAHSNAKTLNDMAARLDSFANELGCPQMPETAAISNQQPGPAQSEAALSSLSGAMAAVRDARNRLGAAVERLTA